MDSILISENTIFHMRKKKRRHRKEGSEEEHGQKIRVALIGTRTSRNDDMRCHEFLHVRIVYTILNSEDLRTRILKVNLVHIMPSCLYTNHKEQHS